MYVDMFHPCMILMIVRAYVNGLGARLGEVRRVRKSTEEVS
jgi:hypothetical protein